MKMEELEKYMKEHGTDFPRAEFAKICKMSAANATYKFKSGSLWLKECCDIARHYGMDLYDFVRIFLDDVYELEE